MSKAWAEKPAAGQRWPQHTLTIYSFYNLRPASKTFGTSVSSSLNGTDDSAAYTKTFGR